MSIDIAITSTSQFFIGEDKTIRYIVYVPGSTQADIDAGIAARQDITGWSITWTLATDPTPLSKTVGAGIALTDAPNGVLEVTVAASDTAGIAAQNPHSVLKRTGAGVNSILSRGPIALQTP